MNLDKKQYNLYNQKKKKNRRETEDKIEMALYIFKIHSNVLKKSHFWDFKIVFDSKLISDFSFNDLKLFSKEAFTEWTKKKILW